MNKGIETPSKGVFASLLQKEKVVPEEPLTEYVTPRKREASRHYRNHAFFTKRAWNVVSKYIEYYTTYGDKVLDPFAGSGVTAVEALVLKRKAYTFDISEWCCFITRMTAIAPIDLKEFEKVYHRIEGNCKHRIYEIFQMSNDAASRILKDLKYPKDELPAVFQRNGLRRVPDLFTPRQLASLSILKQSIDAAENETIRDLMRLVFSYTLVRSNNMYVVPQRRLEAGQRWQGQSAPFQHKNYQKEDNHTELNTWEDFTTRYKNVYRAKKDTNQSIGPFYREDETFTCKKLSATDLLSEVDPQSIDYIFTDPPYTSKIRYLDLATMWNAWLGFEATLEDREKEVIEGGSLQKTSEDYVKGMEVSLANIGAVLKPERWFSLVFANDDIDLWRKIINICESNGLRFVNSVWQPTRLPQYTKIKNPFTAFSGELILNFRKISKAKHIKLYSKGIDFTFADIEEYLRLQIQSIIAAYLGATTEEITRHLINELLSIEAFTDRNIFAKKVKILDFLKNHFERGDSTQKDQNGLWFLREKDVLSENIEVHDRFRYYIFDLLRRYGSMDYDDIVSNVLRKDAVTGGREKVTDILEDVARRSVENKWELSRNKVIQYRFYVNSTYAEQIKPDSGKIAEKYLYAKGFEAIKSNFAEVNEEIKTQEIIDFYRLLKVLRNALMQCYVEYGDRIRQMYAIDQLAKGYLPSETVDLVFVMDLMNDSAYDIIKQLSHVVFGPIFNETDILVTIKIIDIKKTTEFEEYLKQDGVLLFSRR